MKNKMMKYLNLDPGFKPFGDNEISCKIDTFKGGEEHIRISGPYSKFISGAENTSEIDTAVSVTIVTRANSSTEVMRILLANDALRRLGVKKVHLFIPYLPYARQDRVMNTGESLSVKVFANLINSCGFESVSILDPHSDVSPALIENVKILQRGYYDYVGLAIANIGGYGNPCIVSPDAGAYKKIYKTCEGIGFKGDIVLCNKVRNLATNEILNLTVDGDVKDRSCIIIDDICDGGRTFAELGKQLKERGAKAVYLIVTHGIFSYGETQLKPHIDHVWSSNSFRSFDSEFITFIELNSQKIKLN